MSTPLPPQKPQTLLNTITQVVQTLHAKVNFSRLILKPNAKVPELIVHQADTNKAEVYPLLGDHYVVGRSSRTCDIVVRNPLVSQTHISIVRAPKKTGLFPSSTGFLIQDENSTNGLYWGRRRVKELPLRHGDSFTLGPPELASVARVEYRDPPPWYLQTLRYGFYGICGLTAAVGMVVLFESQKFKVDPLPKTVTGPVIIHAADGRPLREANTIAHLEADKLSDFGAYLPKAVVASEDARFYWHLGIDPFGTLRALLTNVRDGEIREGGSTLSQQLARSLYRDYVGTEDSAGRKFKEAVVALKLEAVYGKNKL
ncbi:MAG: transglycosylase domain-containing protein, partial [Planktothrix sp.]